MGDQRLEELKIRYATNEMMNPRFYELDLGRAPAAEPVLRRWMAKQCSCLGHSAVVYFSDLLLLGSLSVR